jgi:hypothetical protein
MAFQSYQLASGHSFFAQSGHYTSPSFLYLSFITMATVGYDDLTPAFGLPRTFSVLEALTGQIFLVVLVSRLVAMYSPTARSRLAEIREVTKATSGDPELPPTHNDPGGRTTTDDSQTE